MIIGNGMLAKALAPAFGEDSEVLVFASGVSNSLETDAAAFDRESGMLASALASHRGRVLYFGSCNIGDADRADTPYARHKRILEGRVLAHPQGLVLRLPQVVGATDNPNTIANYLRDKIMRAEPFVVWEHAERNIIDVDDVALITAALLAKRTDLQRAVAIASRDSLPMPEIVAIFERVLGRTARYRKEARGTPLRIDAAESLRTATDIGLDLGKGYAERVIRKYYGPHA